MMFVRLYLWFNRSFLNENHGDLNGKIRIIPLHVMLLVDVLSAKDDEKKDEYKGMSHYVG